MKKGKIAAQVAHGSLANILNLHETKDDGVFGTLSELFVPTNTSLHDWLKGSFFKIVLKVDSEEELLRVYNEAKENVLDATLITDQGHTVFNGVPTNTVVAIGPHWDHDIDPITEGLKLL
jgi:PTH2 family peptidyl-tRNA hydrolase